MSTHSTRLNTSRGRDRHLWGERGSATLEIAILGPVLLLLVFTVVQAGLWFYARSLALAAATEGVNAARAYQSTPGAGTERAEAFLRNNAHDSLTSTTVSTAGSTAVRVKIEVSGRALSVIPGIPGMTVSQDAEAPVERFTAESGTP